MDTSVNFIYNEKMIEDNAKRSLSFGSIQALKSNYASEYDMYLMKTHIHAISENLEVLNQNINRCSGDIGKLNESFYIEIKNGTTRKVHIGEIIIEDRNNMRWLRDLGKVYDLIMNYKWFVITAVTLCYIFRYNIMQGIFWISKNINLLEKIIFK